MENEEVILLLKKLVKNVKKLRKQMKSRSKTSGDYNPADWALKEEIFAKLSISRATLYRYRRAKKVRWDQKGGLSYYYLPDLLKLKFECMK